MITIGDFLGMFGIDFDDKTQDLIRVDKGK